MPSKIVVSEIKHSHQKWLETPRKDGGKHLDNNLRNFKDENNTYLNRWDFFE